MTDRIRIICSNCRQTFSERANRLKPGYQVQCVHCSRLITFDSGSEEPNIRRPLKAAPRIPACRGRGACSGTIGCSSS